MNIKYPTWKLQTNPTPSDTLWVCDVCGSATWGWYNYSAPILCYCNKKHPRLRRATKEEQEEAKKYLEVIIGGKNEKLS